MIPDAEFQQFTLDAQNNIKFLSDSCVEKFLKSQANYKTCDIDERILHAFSATETPTDVIPGVIEGGFTVWTGSKLLSKHLHNLVKQDKITIKGSTVLELGCGAGIPAIYCLSQWAKSVYLQEYNRDVLRICTMANVRACNFNCEAAQYVAGDWQTMVKEWTTPRFDLIIGSETIYREDLYASQLQLIKQVLKKTGLAILVLKAAYGPGGNLNSFIQEIQSANAFHYSLEPLTSTGTLYYALHFRHHFEINR